MLEVMANSLQGFCHVCFYRESGDMQLFGNRLMAQALYFDKSEYLFLLWRELVNRFLKKFLVLFFNQGMICTIYMLDAMSKFSSGRCFFRNNLNAIENLVTRHRKEVAFKVKYPDHLLTPPPYF